MNYRLTLKFYLNESKVRADGKLPLYLRVIVDRAKSEIALNKYLSASEWDSSRQRTKKDLQLNEHLTQCERRVYDAVRSIETGGFNVDARSIKEVLTGKTKTESYLLQYFADHIAFQERNPELQEATISRYRDTLDHLTQFLKVEKQTTDIQLQRVDLKFVREFELYLLNFVIPTTGKTLVRNTVNKHLTRFKTVILKSMQENVISANPFNGVKMRYTPSKREYLTDSELKSLIDLDLGYNPTLDRVRDTFLWQCYTGLRYEDAMSLKVSDIKHGSDGTCELVTLQEKTNLPVTIPLLPPAITIFRKYDNAQRKVTRLVLPQLSNQKANLYLKHIATLIGLEKTLTTHVARHTCATTVLLKNGISMEVVSKWLGHSQMRTTQIYGKITNDMLRNAATQLINKV